MELPPGVKPVLRGREFAAAVMSQRPGVHKRGPDDEDAADEMELPPGVKLVLRGREVAVAEKGTTAWREAGPQGWRSHERCCQRLAGSRLERHTGV